MYRNIFKHIYIYILMLNFEYLELQILAFSVTIMIHDRKNVKAKEKMKWHARQTSYALSSCYVCLSDEFQKHNGNILLTRIKANIVENNRIRDLFPGLFEPREFGVWIICTNNFFVLLYIYSFIVSSGYKYPYSLRLNWKYKYK